MTKHTSESVVIVLYYSVLNFTTSPPRFINIQLSVINTAFGMSFEFQEES